MDNNASSEIMEVMDDKYLYQRDANGRLYVVGVYNPNIDITDDRYVYQTDINGRSYTVGVYDIGIYTTDDKYCEEVDGLRIKDDEEEVDDGEEMNNNTPSDEDESPHAPEIDTSDPNLLYKRDDKGWAYIIGPYDPNVDITDPRFLYERDMNGRYYVVGDHPDPNRRLPMPGDRPIVEIDENGIFREVGISTRADRKEARRLQREAGEEVDTSGSEDEKPIDEVCAHITVTHGTKAGGVKLSSAALLAVQAASK